MKNPWMVVAALVFWTALAIGLANAYTTLDFTITTGTSAEEYGEIIGDIRNELQAGTYGGIPVLRQGPVAANQQFLLLRISNNRQTITLAINVIDVYFVGYLADANTFWYFSDFDPKPYDKLLFPGSTRKPFTFTGSYTDLKRVAKKGREDIPLGKKEMVEAVTTLFNTATYKDQAPVAVALTLFVQMISESTRFQYITSLVEASFTSFNAFKPKGQMLSYENEWNALNKAVQAGDGKTLKPPVPLKDDAGATYTVSKVSDLIGKLSLMKWNPRPTLTATI